LEFFQGLFLAQVTFFNPGKARKMLIFRATKGQLFKDLMSWIGCQNNPIYLNFHLQKSLEIFEKNQLTKSDLTKTQK
jgi:hypothetical protein